MTTKKRKVREVKLDKDEQEISDALDKGKIERADNIKEKMRFAKEASSNYLRKDARVNIRISGVDLEKLKQKAAFKGLPYQTFIASVLHEYASGHFVSKE